MCFIENFFYTCGHFGARANRCCNVTEESLELARVCPWARNEYHDAYEPCVICKTSLIIVSSSQQQVDGGQQRSAQPTNEQSGNQINGNNDGTANGNTNNNNSSSSTDADNNNTANSSRRRQPARVPSPPPAAPQEDGDRQLRITIGRHISPNFDTQDVLRCVCNLYRALYGIEPDFWTGYSHGQLRTVQISSEHDNGSGTQVATEAEADADAEMMGA